METSFLALDLDDMSVYIGESFATQTLQIVDTVSLVEGTMDGYSYCGDRSITITPELSWLTLQDSMITCGTLDSSLEPISQKITLEVTLDLFPSINL